MNTKQIKTEIDQTDKRLNELRELGAASERQLAEAREKFAGGAGSLDDVQTEQSRLAALTGSIEDLAAKRGEIQLIYDEALQTDHHRALLEQGKAVALEAEASLKEHLEKRSKLSNSMSELGLEMVNAGSTYHHKKREFKRLFEREDCKFGDLEAIGLTSEAYEAVTSEYMNYPAIEFGGPVEIIVRLIADKLDRAAAAARA